MHFHSTLLLVHSNREVVHLAHTKQQRRQRIIVAVPLEIEVGSTVFRFGSEHERKMSSIDPARVVYTSYERES